MVLHRMTVWEDAMSLGIAGIVAALSDAGCDIGSPHVPRP